MLDATIATFGGPYADAEVVENPNTQMAADYGNVLLEDVAQLTRTGLRAVVKFTTSTGGAATYAASAVTIKTMWGDGTAYKPTVAKTATGLYTVTFPASFVDGLGETESLSFFGAYATLVGSTLAPQPKVTSVTATAIGITVMNSSFAANDLSGTENVYVWIR